MYRCNLPVLIISGLLMFGAGYLVGTMVAASHLPHAAPPAPTEPVKDQAPNHDAALDNERHQRSMESCSGIYEFERYGTVKCLDLRSDGTGITYQRQKYSSEKNSRQIITWWLDGDKINIGDLTYRIEGYDLIDSQQNRWRRESL